MYSNNSNTYGNIVNLNKEEAINFLNLDEKIFNNYFVFANKLKSLARDKGEKYYFNLGNSTE